MSNWTPHEYDGETHTDPRSELRARINRSVTVGDDFVAVPVELAEACISLKECQARTTVNGDPTRKILIEVKCTRLVDFVTGKHEGMHVNGRTNW